MLGAALKSAQLPFIIDNESYYIQTIKWVNEYGLVKGLANIHIYLAQVSPWHILQAGLNLSFLSTTFNDLNGFLFIICILYCLLEPRNNEKSNKTTWFSLLPVVSIVFFLFLDAPSPDLPLLVITPLILYLYTREQTLERFKISLILFAFIAFIKITILPVGILFLPALINRGKLLYFIKLLSVFATIWIVKNIIVSGYPLYPFTFITSGNDWVVPQAILDSINTISHKDVYGVDSSTSFIQKLISWLQLDGIKGVFNKLIVFLFLIMLLFKKVRQNKKYLVIYSAFLIHFITLLFISPQYRFFLPEIMFFTLFIISEVVNYLNKETFNTTVILGGVLLSFTLFVDFNFKPLTANKHHQSVSKLKASQLYQPEPITRYPEMKFIKKQVGKFEYYSPETNFFIFGTGNGSLPCVNESQLDYFKQKTGYIPQPRGEFIEEGFISTKALDNIIQ
ncbi:MAG: hypothetical protein BM557_09980 [Flavobacterium sp. MedPE-SWcel]|nr:MAG: hypothetical protein BM557_09980 [Flavobacterium sp. MedPE-SWcel]